MSTYLYCTVVRLSTFGRNPELPLLETSFHVLSFFHMSDTLAEVSKPQYLVPLPRNLHRTLRKKWYLPHQRWNLTRRMQSDVVLREPHGLVPSRTAEYSSHSISTTGFAHVFLSHWPTDTLLSTRDIYITLIHIRCSTVLLHSNRRTSIGYSRLDIRCGCGHKACQSLPRLPPTSWP